MAHEPVLLEDMVAALRPDVGQLCLDATFGGGGYSQAILAASSCRLIGLDRDPQAVERGRALSAVNPNFEMIAGRFSQIQTLLAQRGIQALDGIVADIGVSSFQLDDSERGFSFLRDGPLDMRMSSAGETAADIVNHWDEADLVSLFFRFGEEPEARKVARAIVRRRANQAFRTTLDLADLVAGVKRQPKSGRHPATLVFQALRIQVNDELGELQALLEQAKAILRPGGRLVVVTFHSLEDRLVKRQIDQWGGRRAQPSRHLPMQQASDLEFFRWDRRKSVAPSDDEVRRNPRARSARLRLAIRSGDADSEPDREADRVHVNWKLAA